MRYPIYLVFFFSFLSSTLAFSQNSELDDLSMLNCWRCIVATQSQSSEAIVTKCEVVAKKYDGAIGGEIAQFIIAREILNKGRYSESIDALNSIDFKPKSLQSLVLGLKGDNYSELRKYKLALEQYEQAALTENNTYFSPTYLFKAYMCAMELDDLTKAQNYLTTIKTFYRDFYFERSIAKYFEPNKAKNKPLDIQRN
ncbi:MAG: hypothetical protein HRT57_10770, partial [Crocinitomicaceae bacterium]|nr:hypothetical protein [Crocinitomicaceae bacterium]